VRFATEGERVAVPTDAGTEFVVDRASYNTPYQVVGGGTPASGPSTTVSVGVPPVPGN
jgi:hypothetical protein